MLLLGYDTLCDKPDRVYTQSRIARNLPACAYHEWRARDCLLHQYPLVLAILIFVYQIWGPLEHTLNYVEQLAFTLYVRMSLLFYPVWVSVKGRASCAYNFRVLLVNKYNANRLLLAFTISTMSCKT